MLKPTACRASDRPTLRDFLFIMAGSFMAGMLAAAITILIGDGPPRWIRASVPSFFLSGGVGIGFWLAHRRKRDAKPAKQLDLLSDDAL